MHHVQSSQLKGIGIQLVSAEVRSERRKEEEGRFRAEEKGRLRAEARLMEAARPLMEAALMVRATRRRTGGPSGPSTGLLAQANEELRTVDVQVFYLRKFFPECVARVPVSCGGLGVRLCLRKVVSMSATVRNRLR